MKNLKFAILFLILFKSYETRTVTDQPIVEIDGGKVKGNVLETIWGTPFYAFRGIRYAQPPVGDLRFKAPLPYEPWNDIFDATEDGPICPQPYKKHSSMAEDCLCVNVYTKSLPHESGDELKPVIVYIPGGGFYVGSGASTEYGNPQYLLERDIVLVTLSYRLATLGFLALGTPEAPGNAAMKDIVLALQWVKNNIDKFGGNPNSVTVLGNSAGAVAISFLMVSPMAKNLFHRAIMMSGGFEVQYKSTEDQIDLAMRQAKIMNCTDSSSIDGVYNCLKTTDAFKMSDNLYDMFEFGYDNPIFLWMPVVEPDFGQERFFTQDPYEDLKSGNYTQVPVMIGITENELATSAVQLIRDEKLLHEFEKDFDRVAPICFAYEKNTNRTMDISKTLWNEYNLTHPLTSDSIHNLNNLFGDAIIGFGVHRMVQIFSKKNNRNLFYYKFSYPGRYSHLYYPDDKPFGIEHSDDLLYLFASNSLPKFQKNDREVMMIEKMTRMWAHFAKTGIPIDPTDPYIKSIEWIPFTKENHNYLNIGEEIENRNGLFEDRFAIWDRLYPLD